MGCADMATLAEQLSRTPRLTQVSDQWLKRGFWTWEAFLGFRTFSQAGSRMHLLTALSATTSMYLHKVLLDACPSTDICMHYRAFLDDCLVCPAKETHFC